MSPKLTRLNNRIQAAWKREKNAAAAYWRIHAVVNELCAQYAAAAERERQAPNKPKRRLK